MVTDANDISYWNAIYYLIILLISILTTSMLTLIPRQNAIIYQNYWYEMFIIYVVFFGVTVMLNQVVEAVGYLNVKSLISAPTILKHFIREMLAYGLPYLLFYIIWTMLLNFNHPMPFIGLIGAVLSWGIGTFLIWFLLPSYLTKQKEFRKKVWFYILYQVVWILIQAQLTGLSQIFRMLPPNLQWLMAIFIPICRILDHWILSKVVFRMTGITNCDTPEVILSTAILMKFGLYVAILLASANEFTVWSILAADFIVHLWSGFHVIRLQKKVETDNTALRMEMQREIKHLVLSEIIESLVPLSYAASFATAYYGPNAALIGNVRCNYFDFKEIDDVQYLFTTMVQMFSVDLCGMIVTGITLWIFCKANIFDEFCKFMKEYWFILTLKLAEGFVSTFAQNDISIGLDYTFQFTWITEDGRIRFIQNATDISDYEKLMLLNISNQNIF